MNKYGKIENIVSFQDDLIIAFHLNGLIRLVSNNGYKEEEIDRSVRIFSMAKDIDNEIVWVGTDGEGVIMISKDNSIAESMIMTSLSPFLKRQVRSISTDRYGGLWLGTKGDGIIYFPNYEENWRNKSTVKVFSNSIKQDLSAYIPWESDKRFYTLTESKRHDGMWIGGAEQNLLYFYSFAQQQMTEIKGLRANDKNGKDINRLNVDNKYGTEIHGIYEQNDSTLWIIENSSGLSKINIRRENGEIRIIKQKDFVTKDIEGVSLQVFFSMTAENDSILWLGDRGRGLIRFNINNETYQAISFKKLLNKPVNDILSIHHHTDNKFYIGTTSGFVSFAFENNKVEDVQYIGSKEGLSNEMIHGILSDKDGFLWLSSDDGLNKYNPVNGLIHPFYGEGIMIREFSDGAYYKCPYTGRLFFGGTNGFLYLYNEESVSQKYLPDILLREFFIEGKRASGSNYMQNNIPGWKIKEKNANFKIKYTVPDFINGDDIEYSYFLEGYDKSWSRFSNSNSAVYSNIPSGKYLFKVKYKRDVIDNNDKLLTIPIYIQASWYKSIWFLLILLVGLVLIVLYIKKHFSKHFQLVSKEEWEKSQTISPEKTYKEIIGGHT